MYNTILQITESKQKFIRFKFSCAILYLVLGAQSLKQAQQLMFRTLCIGVLII